MAPIRRKQRVIIEILELITSVILGSSWTGLGIFYVIKMLDNFGTWGCNHVVVLIWVGSSVSYFTVSYIYRSQRPSE